MGQKYICMCVYECSCAFNLSIIFVKKVIFSLLLFEEVPVA